MNIGRGGDYERRIHLGVMNNHDDGNGDNIIVNDMVAFIRWNDRHIGGDGETKQIVGIQNIK